MKAYLTRTDGKIIASVEVQLGFDGGNAAIEVQSFGGSIAGLIADPAAGVLCAGSADQPIPALGVGVRFVAMQPTPSIPPNVQPTALVPPPTLQPPPPGYPPPPYFLSPPNGLSFPGLVQIVHCSAAYPPGSTVVEVYASFAPQVGQFWYCTAISPPPEHVLCDHLQITAVVDEGPAPAFVRPGWHIYKLTLAGPTTAPVSAGQAVSIKSS